MSWESVIADEAAMQQIRDDHGLTEAKYETRRFERVKNQLGVSFRQGFRTGFWDGVEWVLNLQRRVDDLTVAELVAELRKEAGSIYWPLYEADPKFWGDCDRCRTRQLFDARGLCDGCGAEVET